MQTQRDPKTGVVTNCFNPGDDQNFKEGAGVGPAADLPLKTPLDYQGEGGEVNENANSDPAANLPSGDVRQGQAANDNVESDAKLLEAVGPKIAALLADNGLASMAAAKAAPREQLLAIDGIGEATADKILAA